LGLTTIIAEKLKLYFEELKSNTSSDSLRKIYRMQSLQGSHLSSLNRENHSLRRSQTILKQDKTSLKEELEASTSKVLQLEKGYVELSSENEKLKTENEELENAYSRLQQSSSIESEQAINSYKRKIGSTLGHEFKKLEQGIERHVDDSKDKGMLKSIMSKINALIQ
jgi:chromosome segregation ATPase